MIEIVKIKSRIWMPGHFIGKIECSHCHIEVYENDVYCRKCGLKFSYK